MKNIVLYLSSLITLGLFVGCAKEGDDKVIRHQNDAYSKLQDIQTAPEKIRAVGNAVVRLENGTGFFASYHNQTYLVTNAHVLGTEDCARQGCYQQISIDYQKGSDSQTQEFYLKPAAYNENVDVAFYSVSTSSSRSNDWNPPHTLELTSVALDELLNTQIHLIGHPHQGLKKWSTGKVLQGESGYLQTNIFSLKGNSGSPVLNDEGKLVGIHHSSYQNPSQLTQQDFLKVGYSSPAELLVAVIDDGLKSDSHHQNLFTEISLSSVDLDTFIEHSDLYVNAKRIPSFENTSISWQEQLIDQCESDFNSWEQGELDDFYDSLKSCYVGRSLFVCQEEPADAPLTCLGDSLKQRWIDLSKKIHTESLNTPGILSLNWITWNLYAQEKDSEKGNELAKEALTSFLEKHPEEWDFYTAGLLARFTKDSTPTHNGIVILDYLHNYEAQENYAYWFEELIIGVILQTRQAIDIEMQQQPINFVDTPSYQRLKSTYSRIASDPNLSIGARLLLERYAYGWNVLSW